MHFVADLHIHSRFSRATSRHLTPHSLAAWAMVKGVHVLGTGDITHPGWRAELRESLCRDHATGLWRLIQPATPAMAVPDVALTAPAPLFLLQGEISSIYKRDGAVRKVHSLVFMPDFDVADRLCRTLGAIGNLIADGRPILGLDARNLLEITLEAGAVLIPAHIWTPWFSIFGSKSGFDRIEDCFADLSPHIFALETGLSSDPSMNRLWSALDPYTLISNSDAHSGANLARNATLFTGQPSYEGIFAALRRQAADCAYAGTVEFYPEEGKYFLDGHRACNVCLTPEETKALHNICPVCGKPLTIGVLHRVHTLADRTQPVSLPEPGYESLVPLPEVLRELLGVGVQSRAVALRYTALLRAFGPELTILRTVPEEVLRQHWEVLGEAIARMRRGHVVRQAGYDGEYGVVRMFTPQEAVSLRLGKARGQLPGLGTGEAVSRTPLTPPMPPIPPIRSERPVTHISLPPYTDEQERARTAGLAPLRPVLVLAGPGTGKTHTLLGRIAYLRQQGVPAQVICAVTFTRRAAGELRERVRVAGWGAGMVCDTLHALALKHGGEDTRLLLTEESSKRLFAIANPQLEERALRRAWDTLALTRELAQAVPPDVLPCATAYARAKHERGLCDYTDLLEGWLTRLAHAPDSAALWQHILVDEVQDVSPVQWALLMRLLPHGGEGFFGIGDPDQAIYGFRGATPQVDNFLHTAWPTLEIHGLSYTQRSVPALMACASRLLRGCACSPEPRPVRVGTATLRLFEAAHARAEARWVADCAARLLGGTSHTLADTTAPVDSVALLAPADMAVLVRARAQMPLLYDALQQRGVPCAMPEEEACWREPRIAALLAQATFVASKTYGAGESVWSGIPEHIWDTGLTALRSFVDGRPGLDALFWASRAWRELESLWRATPQWPALLTQVGLLREADMVQHKAERVQLLTLHAAKGLEFKAVFLPGLEQGLLPLDRVLLYTTDHNTDTLQPSPLDEERRLLYVGITRAADAVYASYARTRVWRGKVLRLAPSCFVPLLREHMRLTVMRQQARTEAAPLSLL